MDRAKHGDFAALEKDIWARPDVVQGYAREFTLAALQSVPTLVAQSGAGRGDDALDICCGHGIVTEALIRVEAHVTGLDFSPAMLELARARVPAATFIPGNAMQLPFGDARFDAVTIGFGIAHVPDPAVALAEARRVLRPGGRLAFSVWEGQDVASALTYVFEAAEQYGDPALALPPGPGPSDFAVRSFAIPALEEAGFSRINFDYVPSVWTVDDPGAPYDHFLEGTVRGAALLGRQPEANAAAIRAAVAARVREELGEEGPWTVPLPSVVISATAI